MQEARCQIGLTGRMIALPGGLEGQRIDTCLPKIGDSFDQDVDEVVMHDISPTRVETDLSCIDT